MTDDTARDIHPNAAEMMERSERLARYQCFSCGKRSEKIDREAYRWAVWAQTPLSVIREYEANGYTLHEAIAMEMSYA